jgi:hypothetical protein
MFRLTLPGSYTCFLSVLFLALIFAGCSEPAKTGTVKPKDSGPPPAPVTGRSAFQRMYIQARAWAPDAQPLRLSSFNLKEVASDDGKCGAWQAIFVSQQRSKARSYTYSVIESPGNVHEGVLPGREEAWSGPHGQTRPFLLQAVKADSDEAYAAAVKKSSDYLKKNPGVPVQFLLEATPRFPNPAWRVIWGETLGTSDYSVFVDASTGEYLQTLH